MLTFYDYLPSQNAYKVRQLLQLLDIPHSTELISIFEGEGHSNDYHSVNPVGAVPGLRLSDGRTLAESNAILVYLAEGSPYLPDDPFDKAKVLQWLFFEADYVQSSVATLRHWILTGKDKNRPPETIAAISSAAVKTLGIVDRSLEHQPFLCGVTYTIADISIYAYVHLAEDAGLELSEFSHLKDWIYRIQQLPGYLDQIYPYSIDPHSYKEL